MCICVCVYVWICEYVYTWTHTHIHVYTYTHVHTYICVCMLSFFLRASVCAGCDAHGRLRAPGPPTCSGPLHAARGGGDHRCRGREGDPLTLPRTPARPPTALPLRCSPQPYATSAGPDRCCVGGTVATDRHAMQRWRPTERPPPCDSTRRKWRGLSPRTKPCAELHSLKRHWHRLLSTVVLCLCLYQPMATKSLSETFPWRRHGMLAGG